MKKNTTPEKPKTKTQTKKKKVDTHSIGSKIKEEISHLHAPDIHLPPEKKIKKRTLLIGLITVITVAVVLFALSGAYTGYSINVTKKNVATLQNLINDQKQDFSNSIVTLKKENQTMMDRFNKSQVELQNQITQQVNTLNDEVSVLADTDQEIKNTVKDKALELQSLSVDYRMTTDGIKTKTTSLTQADTILEKRDEQMQKFVLDFQTKSIESQMSTNSFLIQLAKKQIEFLEAQNSVLLEAKLTEVTLVEIPAEKLEVNITTETLDDLFESIPETVKLKPLSRDKPKIIKTKSPKPVEAVETE